MTKLFTAAALLAMAAASAHAEAPDRWFGTGMMWGQHPCGQTAFAKYGADGSRQVRHNYFVALRDPSQCAKLFP